MRRKVGIWHWKTTSNAACNTCPTDDFKLAQSYADIKGWDIVAVYELNNFDEKTVIGHAEREKLFTDIKSGRIDILICLKMAYLGCNTKELFEVVEYFNENNADLVFLTEAIDTSTQIGKHFYSHIHALNQSEYEECSRRVRVSIPQRVLAGKPLGGAAPFGYKWVNKKLEIDETEAPVRKFMFECFAMLRAKKAVARELNKRGFRTRRGNKFTDTTVNRLLKDAIVIGKRTVNYTQSTGHNKQWKRKPKSEWFIVSAPPIISEELFHKVQAIMVNKNIST